MKARFEGENAGQLITAIKAQEFVGGNAALADALIAGCVVVEFKKGDTLIEQNDTDNNDVFLLVAGTVAVIANGNQIAERKAGEHVGEMAAIEPAQARSTSIVAQETVVALKISSAG